MSRRRPSVQELTLRSIERTQERERYETFLQSNGYENTPHYAHVYTMRQGYSGQKARDTIILLAGSLPEQYD